MDTSVTEAALLPEGVLSSSVLGVVLGRGSSEVLRLAMCKAGVDGVETSATEGALLPFGVLASTVLGVVLGRCSSEVLSATGDSVRNWKRVDKSTISNNPGTDRNLSLTYG